MEQLHVFKECTSLFINIHKVSSPFCHALLVSGYLYTQKQKIKQRNEVFAVVILVIPCVNVARKRSNIIHRKNVNSHTEW